MSKLGRVLLYGPGGIVLVGIVGYAALHLGHPDLRSPHQRGPTLQSVRPDSVWVVWDTVEPTTGVVEYGLGRALKLAVQETDATRHHEVQLTGLQPYAVYY